MATAADLAQPLAWIDQMSVAMVERLVAWSGINSGTHNVAGLNAMADQIQALFSPLAGSSEQIALEDSEQLGDEAKLILFATGRC